MTNLCFSSTVHLTRGASLVKHMPRPLVSHKADILDGKIYVVEGEGRVLVFDTEKQTWEEPETRPDMGKHCLCCVAMSSKIYIRTDKNSFVYEPKEGKWETDVRVLETCVCHRQVRRQGEEIWGKFEWYNLVFSVSLLTSDNQLFSFLFGY